MDSAFLYHFPYFLYELYKLYETSLHLTYEMTDSLTETAIRLWSPEITAETTYIEWGISQIHNLLIIFLVIIFLVISALLFCLAILKKLGIEKLMAIILTPFLHLLGISKAATNITIIGATLGLSFGGGLLINEAQKGHVAARDVFTAIMLLNLLHSLIEDTLLILLIGADFNTIFWGRLVFSVLIIALMTIFVNKLSNAFCERYLYRSVAHNI